MNLFRKRHLAVLFSLLLSIQAFAQTFRGTVSGAVVDPQGAVVANAEIKLVNPATSATITANSAATMPWRGRASCKVLRAGVLVVTVGVVIAVVDGALVPPPPPPQAASTVVMASARPVKRRREIKTGARVNICLILRDASARQLKNRRTRPLLVQRSVTWRTDLPANTGERDVSLLCEAEQHGQVAHSWCCGAKTCPR